MIFVLKNILFMFVKRNVITVKCLPLSNYADLVKLEQKHNRNQEPQSHYLSSVNVRSDYYEIVLNLNENLSFDLYPFTQTGLNFHLEIVGFDPDATKYVYKIHQIEIADVADESIPDEEDTERILEDYEIKTMYKTLETELLDKIHEKRSRLDDLQMTINRMSTSLENIEILDKIKRTFETYT